MISTLVGFYDEDEVVEAKQKLCFVRWMSLTRR